MSIPKVKTTDLTEITSWARHIETFAYENSTGDTAYHNLPHHEATDILDTFLIVREAPRIFGYPNLQGILWQHNNDACDLLTSANPESIALLRNRIYQGLHSDFTKAIELCIALYRRSGPTQQKTVDQIASRVALPIVELMIEFIANETNTWLTNEYNKKNQNTETKANKSPNSRAKALALATRTKLSLVALEQESVLNGYFSLPNHYLFGLAGKERFSEVKEVSRSMITVRKEQFQNREGEYSQETFDKIVREGYDRTEDPIVVWHDPDTRKYVILAGHSRWAASEFLFNQGDKSLKTMPVKVFLGTQQEAWEYANLESNRGGTKETMREDVAAYKKAKAAGKDKDYLLSIFKTTHYVNVLDALSYLNPKGRFMEFIGTPMAEGLRYLLRNARWVGALRKRYPALTDSHERELFEFMYEKYKGDVAKDKFDAILDRKLNSMFMDYSQPLNLANLVSTSGMTQHIRDQITELQSEVRQLQSERIQKEDSIARALVELEPGSANQQKRLKELRDRKYQLDVMIGNLLSEIKELEAAEHKGEKMAYDLFNPTSWHTAAPPQQKTESNSALVDQKKKAKALALATKVKLQLAMGL